jgi:hypothetical protein
MNGWGEERMKKKRKNNEIGMEEKTKRKYEGEATILRVRQQF